MCQQKVKNKTKMEAQHTMQQKPKKKKKQQHKTRVKVGGKARLGSFSKSIDGELDGIEAARDELGAKKESPVQRIKISRYNNSNK